MKKIDSHADKCVVGVNCLVIHEHDRPVNVYSHDPKYGHKCDQTVNSAVCCDNPHIGQKYSLVIDHAIQIRGFKNIYNALYSVIWMVCISIKFLANSPSEATHAIQVNDPLNAAHLLVVPLQ